MSKASLKVCPIHIHSRLRLNGNTGKYLEHNIVFSFKLELFSDAADNKSGDNCYRHNHDGRWRQSAKLMGGVRPYDERFSAFLNAAVHSSGALTERRIPCTNPRFQSCSALPESALLLLAGRRRLQ
jgi:hypothetical protein